MVISYQPLRFPQFFLFKKIHMTEKLQKDQEPSEKVAFTAQKPTGKFDKLLKVISDRQSMLEDVIK